MAQPTVTVLKNRKIVLGVTGSIAVYKAVDLASKLTQAGALVDVIMTESAKRFVTPLTFQSVTGRAVYDSLWESRGDLPTHIAHVGLGESADLLVVAPATADVLASFARGEANDLLRVTYLAARCPKLVAPAMDGGMYSHPAVSENLAILRERGLEIIEPEQGRFASGLTGKGRLPETATLMGHIRRALGANGRLAGRQVVVTAGGTREALDPVRFITNHSSGRQGHAVAQAAIDAGAQVTLVTAARDLAPPVGARVVPVDSAREMLEAVLETSHNADALLMSAAVSDYRPSSVSERKIKKAEDETAGMALELARNPDILLEVKKQRASTHHPAVVVGFAAETDDLIANAQSKLERKGLDLIVANDVGASDAGFRAETNRVIIIDRSTRMQEIDLTSKTEIAEIIVGRVADLLDEPL